METAIQRLLDSAKVEVSEDISGVEIEDRNYYLDAYMDFDEGSNYFFFARKTSKKVSAETLQRIELSNEAVELIETHLTAEYNENQPIEDEDLAPFDGYQEYGVSNEMFINL